MKSRFKIDKINYIVVGAVVLSVVVTSGFYYLQQQQLLLRNKFLEEWHQENYQAINDCHRLNQSVQNAPTATSESKVFFQRSFGQLHRIVVGDGGRVTVTTLDEDTGEEVLTVKDANPFNQLFANMRWGDFSDVVIAQEGENYYAVLKISLGLFGDQLYLIQTDEYNSNYQVKALEFYPQDKLALCSLKLVDYFPKRQQILIDQGCGDACWGTGDLVLLTLSGQKTKLMNYASGCGLEANEEELSLPPTYLGYVQGKLFFGEVEMEDGNWKNTKIVKIFQMDPFSRQRQYLDIDLSQIQLGESWRLLENQLRSNELPLQGVYYDANRFFALDVVEETIREVNLDDQI